ncbi:MAG: RNA polymerase factor sigma-54 [Alphaproteobacteria bacterium]|nr:RNA polymerase factor sigma-54 [Alphaproteobacteria bacterium]
MALSAQLQLRQNQSVVMTPQLMQSIRLLQLTHAELLQYIEQEVEKNPLLNHETDRGDGPTLDLPTEPGAEGILTSADDENTHGTDWFRNELDHTGKEISAQMDTAQEDMFPEDSGAARPDSPELAAQWKSMPGTASLSNDTFSDLDGFAAKSDTLRDHVAEQLIFAFSDSVSRLVAADLADHLDEAGYLPVDVMETADRLNVDVKLVEQVLQTLQEFDPPGLFARNLSECLAIQLRRKERLDPAMECLVGNLELLARRDFKTLRRLCGVQEADLLDMMAEIRTLDPKPGNRFDNANIQAIVPDILVRPAADGTWSVELNAETLPRVLFDQAYYLEVSSQPGNSEEDREYLNECMRNANWLTRSLDQRAKTIMKVAAEIVLRQSDFLTHGVENLRPMTLKSVADAIQMHESTVSRVTSNKYMLTPRGIFELKFFFTAAIAAASGGAGHSSEAVRHRIRQMIDAEKPTRVLSDDVIVRALKQDGIDIARRTVAKYREAMNIASSVQRRREKGAMDRAGL